MTLVKFGDERKYEGMNPWVHGFSDFFESFLSDSVGERLISKIPAVNIAESEAAFHIELAAPGLERKDFKINLDKNILSISGEQKSDKVEKDKRYNKREYSYASFVRSFTLPDNVNDQKISATYNDGILKVSIAKKEPSKVLPKEIAIQ